MAITRRLSKSYTPKPEQGFLGAGHIAKAVIQLPFSESDPFILLMDDMLDKKDDQAVGGPHPHAGFETVSLLLEGEMGDKHHRMTAGDFQMMTAGSGVIHTETIDKKVKMRLLQLWLTLPKQDRWATPRVQDISLKHVPKSSKDGVDIKLYSGNFAGLSSPVKNYTPVIIADIQMQADVSSIQYLPASYTTFLYVIAGSIQVGEEKKVLKQNQVGWLDRHTEDAQSELQLTAGAEGARFILYSGQPQTYPVVSHGPFIGDSSEDIQRLYAEYRHGKMGHISEVEESQKLVW